jgi:hypothetical protein
VVGGERDRVQPELARRTLAPRVQRCWLFGVVLDSDSSSVNSSCMVRHALHDPV